jgi:hypothetical protein
MNLIRLLCKSISNKISKYLTIWRVSFDRSDEFDEIAFLNWELDIKECKRFDSILLFKCERWFCKKIEELSAADQDAANESIEIRD